MNVSKNLTIAINMRPVSLQTVLFSSLKYTHKKRKEKDSIKYQSTEPWKKIQQILRIDPLQHTMGDAKKTLMTFFFHTICEHFFNKLLKTPENYTNEHTLHRKRTLLLHHSTTKEPILLHHSTTKNPFCSTTPPQKNPFCSNL